MSDILYQLILPALLIEPMRSFLGWIVGALVVSAIIDVSLFVFVLRRLRRRR